MGLERDVADDCHRTYYQTFCYGFTFFRETVIMQHPTVGKV